MPTDWTRIRTVATGVFLYKTGTGKKLYAVDFRRPQDHRKARRMGFTTETAAVAFRDENERRLAGLDPIGRVDDVLTFRELARKFLDSYRTRSGRIVYYEQRARIWVAHFGDKFIDTILQADVETFRTARSSEVSPSTVRKDLVSLSTLFRWAMANQLLIRNPADPIAVKRPSAPAPRPNPLTVEEEERLLAALPEHVRPIIVFCLETGADRSEAVRLRWDVVDREAKLIHLPRAKTGTQRALPYWKNRRLRELIDDAADKAEKNGRVFLDDEGDPVTLEASKSAMRRAWRSAIGRRKSRPWKSLRATFATRRIERGVSVPVVAELCGLTSSHVLEHYVKPRAAHLEDALGD